MPQALPMTVDDLTPEWLTTALQRSAPGVAVDAVEVRHVVWGTATKVFLKLAVGDSAGGTGLPENVVIKGGFEERLRAFGAGPAYELEAAFYRDLAPELTIPVPQAFFADVQPDRQGVVILEDLTDRAVTFGDPRTPWTTDQVERGLAILAQLHAATWGTSPGRFPWLTTGTAVFRGPVSFLFSSPQFEQLTARPGLPALTGDLADNQKVLQAYRNLWAHDDVTAQVICHGDPHVGQTYIEPNGDVAFLDWQNVTHAPWADDFAYFTVGALDVETRRSTERELLQGYLAALRALGGPEIAFDDAWLEYRRHALHGVVWQVTPDAMQHIDIVTTMATRYIAAAEDLETLQANAD